MSPRPRSVSDDEVMAATARVVSRDGPAALTVAGVAAEAGLAASSLVERYGTKRDLLLAFAARGPDALRAAFARARARHPDPFEALRSALHAMASGVRTRKAMANHLAFLHVDLSDPAFRKHAVAHGLAFREEVASLLGVDEPTARAVQVAYNGALVTWAIHGEGTVAEAIDAALAVVATRGEDSG